jgi:antitoxin component of MazEF toxin-antitoxin module
MKRTLSFITKLRRVGNSNGVILNNQMISSAGFNPGDELIIEIKKGAIILTRAEQSDINTNLSTWDRHFKSMIKKGESPDDDYYEHAKNDFDNEW